MNQKFYCLPKEKQQRIIDAAYRVFLLNAYKKAPMAEIAAEAGISKSLLFHYFDSKRDLYLFLWHTCMEEVHQASLRHRVCESPDFFDILHRSLLAKCSVMRTFPSMYLFAIHAWQETNPAVRVVIQTDYARLADVAARILWETADLSTLRPDIDAGLLYQEILWTAAGYLSHMSVQGTLDADRMEQDSGR